ncbi:hypothetical protein [Clostridium cibarium]|uniref:Trm112 family protein n=1 Tax=Clostridium cibarium TaxID=2762247 RepID=A0ABR8PTN2_9CLOT|nr:hypothetical protein [Clostridium cibarium]MBD7911470.1 hypothetical protein [Clostridium cibarium]
MISILECPSCDEVFILKYNPIIEEDDERYILAETYKCVLLFVKFVEF